MFSIRKVVHTDLHELQKIGKDTFNETFAADNLISDMEKYLEESFSFQKLQTELNNPNSAFYFAVDEHKVVGYLKVNIGDAQTENILPNSFEIERIYVRSAYHGQKIGKLLFNKAKRLAEEKNINKIWLGVWEENFNAIKFYENNGFIVFGSHNFVLGKDIQTDVMMTLELN
ncbi:MAG: GNAT family N-acetyltransferase [Flavobacteriaceae bacterium]|nr:GNAT family N-acetyltransferase [Flavobacteriaceae bacterium]